jgi:hypothetical protein
LRLTLEEDRRPETAGRYWIHALIKQKGRFGMAKETPKKKTARPKARTAGKAPVKKAAAPKKKEMNDYAGPFIPNLTFEDFSKEFLLKLMHVWQYGWLHMTEAWYNAVKQRYGVDAANDCETQAWETIGERVNPRFAKVANIELNTVLDSLKCLQLPLDNTTGGLFPAEAKVINPNHVIWTIPRCRSLEFFEAKEPERIRHVCHINEKRIIERYLVNRKIKVTPLKLPPRKSPDEIACQWEFTLEQ